MSISAIAQDSTLYMQMPASGGNGGRRLRPGVESRRTASGAGKDQATVPPGPLAVLVKYIPTETIAVYIAVQAALGALVASDGQSVSDIDFTARWWWFGIMTVATVVLTIGLSFRLQRTANAQEPYRLPVFDVAAAGLAFVVWALSLPNTPLLDIEGYDYSAWNGVLILGGTVVIASSAYVFGRVVEWKKVVPDLT